jgi:hypothetical protein
MSVWQSPVLAESLTIRENGSLGIYSEQMTLGAGAVAVVDNYGTGIHIGMGSSMHMCCGSTVSGNASDGIGDYGRGYVALEGGVTASNNGYNGVSIGDLAEADFGGGVTVTGNGTTGIGSDVGCTGSYSVAAGLEYVTYGSTNCPVPSVAQNLGKVAPRRLLLPPGRPSVK